MYQKKLLQVLKLGMKKKKLLKILIDRMKNQLGILKTVQNNQIGSMVKLKNLRILEKLLKKPVQLLIILI